MSEIMTPIPFRQLLHWMLEEYRQQGRVFGISKENFYYPPSNTAFHILNTRISSPIGPAAGPNTQLAQNLVAAYVCGARFFELKTVQTMDGEALRQCVPRPCINAQDEGYNCEWSTELTVQEAFDEYVKGWFLLHVAAYEWGLSVRPDFIFNMSVGYDMEGIQSPKIDTFINHLQDARETAIWRHCQDILLDVQDQFNHLSEAHIREISPCISSSITLSTLHGCPPEEIEKIAHYFLTQKHLHTYIKCNPTLLGYETTRQLLDDLGYDYVAFDTHHFDQDLKMHDAVALIQRLMNTAKQQNQLFGVKLTNTFPVQIQDDELPGETMYMSGRALYPLSLHVAEQLSRHFGGRLPISYSGGADHFTLDTLLNAGIQPITVCTTILKPGGYSRLKQLSTTAQSYPSTVEADERVRQLHHAIENLHHIPQLIKGHRETYSRKTDSKLPLYDCFKAPCKEGGCPLKQQIPEYLDRVAEERYDDAFAIIAIDNATPSILSKLCNHPCQSKCTRIDYESPLQIREAKHRAVSHAQQNYIQQIQPSKLKSDAKVLVIGAGPAGIAAGTYLRRNGVFVQVIDKRDAPMGLLQHVVPAFRVSQQDMDLDYQMAVQHGVQFQFNVDENYDISQLKATYDYIIIATGAWSKGRIPVESGQEHVLDAMEYLEKTRQSYANLHVGKTVAVIGGGDVAMDCARAALRIHKADTVHILYRRTEQYMPAEPEEIRLAKADGVEFHTLLSPLAYDGKTLQLQRMTLAEKAADGRRKPIPTGEIVELRYDTVISATGAHVDSRLMESNHIQLDGTYPVLNPQLESSINNVYIAGDCRQGPATIVQAVADSKHIAMDILSKLDIQHDFIRINDPQDATRIHRRKAVLTERFNDHTDAQRCLSCDTLCEICVDVCPNRANQSILVNRAPQILHIDAICNECGNCGTFCPHVGNPYRDKITLFDSLNGFNDSKNRGFLLIDSDQIMVRDEEHNVWTGRWNDSRLSDTLRAMIETVYRDYSYFIDGGVS